MRFCGRCNLRRELDEGGRKTENAEGKMEEDRMTRNR